MRDPSAAARAGGEFWDPVSSAKIDDERTVPRLDDIALAEQHPLDPQAVDLGPVGASQVDQVAEWELALDLEMFARQQAGPGSRGIRPRGPADRVRIAAVDHVFLTGVRASRYPAVQSPSTHPPLPRSESDLPCLFWYTGSGSSGSKRDRAAKRSTTLSKRAASDGQPPVNCAPAASWRAFADLTQIDLAGAVMGISSTWMKSRAEGSRPWAERPRGGERGPRRPTSPNRCRARTDRSPCLGSGTARDGHVMFVDPGHLHDRRLDADMRNHLAGDLGEPAGAVGDLEKPVVVHVTDVTGDVPTPLEHLGGRLGTIQVAHHDLRPLDGDDALVTLGEVDPGVAIDRLDRRTGHRHADRPRAVAGNRRDRPAAGRRAAHSPRRPETTRCSRTPRAARCPAFD